MIYYPGNLILLFEDHLEQLLIHFHYMHTQCVSGKLYYFAKKRIAEKWNSRDFKENAVRKPGHMYDFFLIFFFHLERHGIIEVLLWTYIMFKRFETSIMSICVCIMYIQIVGDSSYFAIKRRARLVKNPFFFKTLWKKLVL